MTKTLITDDIEKWHEVVEKNLRYYEFSQPYLHAYDIKKGLELYESHKPELVITDINFDVQDKENIDGLTLCKQIREQDKDTKIIVMSSTENIKERAMGNGADYFIQKKDFVNGFDNFIAKFYPNRKK